MVLVQHNPGIFISWHLNNEFAILSLITLTEVNSKMEIFSVKHFDFAVIEIDDCDLGVSLRVLCPHISNIISTDHFLQHFIEVDWRKEEQSMVLRECQSMLVIVPVKWNLSNDLSIQVIIGEHSVNGHMVILLLVHKQSNTDY